MTAHIPIDESTMKKLYYELFTNSDSDVVQEILSNIAPQHIHDFFRAEHNFVSYETARVGDTDIFIEVLSAMKDYNFEKNPILLAVVVGTEEEKLIRQQLRIRHDAALLSQ